MKAMRFTKTLGIALATLGLSAATSRAAITLDFATTTGANIQFNGGGTPSTGSSFQFTSDGSGNQFQITSGGIDSNGDKGSFTGGPFNYGAITTLGDGSQFATVTTSGGIVIKDGTGGTVNGNVAFIQVGTFSASGSINGQAMVDVTGLTYTGGSPPQTDLEALVANGLGTMVLTFQFGSTNTTLTTLTTANVPYDSSFSGVITSSVPEPTTILAGMLLLLPMGISAFRIIRNGKLAAA
jgi:hypothetical protein